MKLRSLLEVEYGVHDMLKRQMDQIKLDSDSGDLTAVEELFLGLENAEEQLKAFLPEQLEGDK